MAGRGTIATRCERDENGANDELNDRFIVEVVFGPFQLW